MRVPSDRELDVSRRIVTGLAGVRQNICGQVAEIEIQVNPDGTFGYLHIEKNEARKQFDEGEGISVGQLLNLILRTLVS